MNLKRKQEPQMIADTFYYLIKLHKKVFVPRLRKKEVEVRKNGDEEKYI